LGLRLTNEGSFKSCNIIENMGSIYWVRDYQDGVEGKQGKYNPGEYQQLEDGQI